MCLILGISIGLVTGYFIRVRIHEKSFAKTRSEAEKIIAMAEEDAEKKKKTQEKKKSGIRILACIAAVAVILAVIVGITGAVNSANKREQQKLEEI